MKIFILLFFFITFNLQANEVTIIELHEKDKTQDIHIAQTDLAKDLTRFIKNNYDYDLLLFLQTHRDKSQYFFGRANFSKKLLGGEIKGAKGKVNWPEINSDCKISLKYSSRDMKISCVNATYRGSFKVKSGLISASLQRTYISNDVFKKYFPKNLSIASFNDLQDLSTSDNKIISNFVRKQIYISNATEETVQANNSEIIIKKEDINEDIVISEVEDIVKNYENDLFASIIEIFDLKTVEKNLSEEIEFVEIDNGITKDFNLSFNLSDNILKYIKFSNEKIVDEFSRDYIFAYSLDKAITRRLTQSRELHNSEYLYGTQEIENPEYSKLLIEINLLSNQVDRALTSYELAKQRAQNYLDSQSDKSCGNDLANFLCGAMEKKIAENMYKEQEENYNRLNSRLSSMNSRLLSMPLVVKKDIYDTYQYSTSKVKSVKYIEAVYHLINLKENTLQSLKIKNELSRDFNYVYNLHEGDVKLKSILSNFDSEEDIVKWEKASAELPLYGLVSGIDKSQIKLRKFDSIIDLEKVVTSINKIQIEESPQDEEKTSILSTQYDDRFQSVVIIQNSSNDSIGTGFFIKPNVILTNYHVVEGAPNPTVSLFGKQFDLVGRVIAADLRLDLAMIEVSHEGKPLEIAKDFVISIGTEVEAIGHPFGNSFTLTRGIISAIRLSESTFMVGGKPVYYIQTDTAINSGNSGGPLFINNIVVGVNTQVVRKDLAEGLNFAVHFEEVNEFVNYHLNKN